MNPRFKKTGAHQVPDKKAKNTKLTIIKLASSLKSYKISIILVLFFAIGSTVFSILGPKILGDATTELYQGFLNKISGDGGINFNAIWMSVMLLGGLYIVSALFSYIQGFLITDVAQKFTYKLRDKLSRKIHNMPFGYFDSQNNGEVLSVITNDIETLSQNLNQGIMQAVTSFVTVVGILVMMFLINPLMALIAIGLVPVSLILVTITAKISQKHFRRQQEYLGHVNGQVEEVFGAEEVIRAFNGEKNALEKFHNFNETLYSSAWKSQFISGLMHPITVFVGNIGYVAMAVLGGYLATAGKLTVGNIQSFIQYTRQFTHPLAQLAQVSVMIQSTVAAAERVFDFLSLDEEENANTILSANNINGNVEFKDISFGYDDKLVIHNFSLKVNNAKKIAIVGSTGAGKTTIVKLLLRFYDVNSGEILIDGCNIKNFERQELRKSFGMVLQDTWLFSGTIMENIRYGKKDATDEEVISAAKAAHAHHFIKTLPGGYNMELLEGAGNISAGQKQLLTIARAILANPKILILDEATSSVDTRTEERIQKAMDFLMSGRTSFIIAHRLSTIRNADLILVMKDGGIAERGNHDELINQKGLYYELYNSQFELAVNC